MLDKQRFFNVSQILIEIYLILKIYYLSKIKI